MIKKRGMKGLGKPLDTNYTNYHEKTEM